MNDYKDLEIKEINQEEQRKRKLMENQQNKPKKIEISPPLEKVKKISIEDIIKPNLLYLLSKCVTV